MDKLFVWPVSQVRIVCWFRYSHSAAISGHCFPQLIKPPDLWIWEKVKFFLSPPYPPPFLGWHAMVFPDNTNLLLWAWQCTSLSACQMKLFVELDSATQLSLLIKPPDWWIWEKVKFFLSPPYPAPLLEWPAMVFPDKTNLLLWAWQCASLSAPPNSDEIVKFLSI